MMMMIDWLIKGAPVRWRDWSTRLRILVAAKCRRCREPSRPVSRSCWWRRWPTVARVRPGTCSALVTDGRRPRRSTERRHWDERRRSASSPSHWRPSTRSHPCRNAAGLHTRTNASAHRPQKHGSKGVSCPITFSSEGTHSVLCPSLFSKYFFYCWSFTVFIYRSVIC